MAMSTPLPHSVLPNGEMYIKTASRSELHSRNDLSTTEYTVVYNSNLYLS